MLRLNYRTIYILSDILSSAIAWSLFFIYRKVYIETLKFGIPVPFQPDITFFAGLILIPAFWFLLYYSGGSYKDIRRTTHSKDAVQLLLTTLIGAFVIFFCVILDDTVISYRNYYQSFLVLLTLQYLLTFVGRNVILLYKNYRFKKGKDDFRVIMAGNSDRIMRFTSEHYFWLRKSSLRIVGYALEDFSKDAGEKFSAPVISINNLDRMVDELNAEEVFIISETQEVTDFERILLQLFRKDVYIRILSDLYPLLKMPMKVIQIDTPLLLYSKDILPAWQQGLKAFLDIVLSVLAIVVLFPLILVLIVVIKATSRGPVLYQQERIGKHGRPFKILKFRSMYIDSEPEGPRLAKRNDIRITPIGRFMRKRRLDEIPNFINVFKGDMSLVGPRPEREHYISQIIDKAPQYAKLHLVKPGITSWGQVKYGYAENIDEMMQRMRYDLVYIENMSLFVDLQILLKTIGIIIKGHGV